jgi:rSAM/selenodomain-associated transferase 2
MHRRTCSRGSSATTRGCGPDPALVLTPNISPLSPVSLSIIMPCLNESACIALALDALASVRDKGVEVIVVDGGSIDGTPDLAQPRADLVITSRRGRASQMNAGAARARGEILLFLHADSRLPERAEALVLEGLARSGSAWGRFDVTIGGRHPLLRVVTCLMNLRSRWTGIATGDQGIFVTRALFERAGRYPEIHLMEDVALAAKLKRYGAPLCLSERITTSGRRWEKHGVLRTILLMWLLRLAYWMGADPDKLALRYASHK